MVALARFDRVVDQATIPTVAIFGLMALVTIENEQLAPPSPPPPPLPLQASASRATPNRTTRAPRKPEPYGTAATGTMCLTDLALPLTSPLRTLTGTGGVSLKR